MALNAKQKLFVQEYLLDNNATRAAKAAGYSKESAHSCGPRLLDHAEIKSEIKKAQKKIQEQAEKKVDKDVVFTKAMWLRELRLLAMANMDDFMTVDEVEVYTDSKTGKPITQITANAVPTLKRRHKSLGRIIKKITETKNGISIELHSKQAALDTLGKHHGWVKDNVQVDDKNKPKVILTMPSNGRTAEENITETNLPEPEDEGDNG